MKNIARPLGAVVAALLFAGAGGAQTTTAESASILVFPKVIVDSSWDTAIQLSNDANRPARAICYYVNGAPTFPELPSGPQNPPLWSQVDFRLSLTRQQPTDWVVSRGRILSDDDGACRAPFENCEGNGLDPGLIPPVEAVFSGELLCVEVDASGAPWSGNALSGYATLTHRASGEVVKYPGIGVSGLPGNDGDGTLCLGGQPSSDCPHGAEYRGCSDRWTVSHRTEFDDRASGGDASRTSLTIVPCGQDFVTQQPGRLTLQFTVISELEQRFSASASVECWTELPLAELNEIFHRDVLGADWAQTRIRAAAVSPGGFLVVQQTAHDAPDRPLLTAVASVPAQGATEVPGDLIRLSAGGVE